MGLILFEGSLVKKYGKATVFFRRLQADWGILHGWLSNILFHSVKIEISRAKVGVLLDWMKLMPRVFWVPLLWEISNFPLFSHIPFANICGAIKEETSEFSLNANEGT